MKTVVVPPVAKYAQLSALYTCTKFDVALFPERNLKESQNGLNQGNDSRISVRGTILK
jgi:hypothetical protein